MRWSLLLLVLTACVEPPSIATSPAPAAQPSPEVARRARLEASWAQREAGDAFLKECGAKANKIRNAKKRSAAHLQCSLDMTEAVRVAGDKAFRSAGGVYHNQR